MKRAIALLSFLFTATCLVAGEIKPAQVTLPLQDYETLRRAQERASVTVIDTMRLSGSFHGRDIRVAFTGRSAGRLPAETVLRAEGVVLFGCEGEAIVSRGEDGAFALTPLASRFMTTCHLVARGSDRIEMSVTRAVLWVESNVSDGEFVWGAEQADGARSFTVVRRAAVAIEGLKPSAIGRYLLSLRPDETRFRYTIEAHNPNRTRQTFDVTLSSGEHVQQVDAPATYEVEQARYRFDLPPGDTILTLTGSLSGKSFVSPVEAGLQYFVLEAHPLLQPLVAGNPKPISLQETGIAAEFRGAQAFLLEGRQRVEWSVTRLEVLSTTSFALRNSWSIFFLSPDGWALGETTFEMDNQGAADVSVPIEAQMTYAGLNGEPVLLTKDTQGHLWLPISQGEQKLVIQHRQPFTRWPGFAFASLALPQMSVPATQATLEVRYPKQWFPLYAEFLSEASYWHPDFGLLFVFVLLVVWTERMLAFLGLARRSRIIVAIVATIAALAWGWAATVLVIADLAVTGLWLALAIRHLRLKLGMTLLVTVAVGFFVLLIAAISIPSLLRARVSYTPSSRYDGRAMSSMPGQGLEKSQIKAPATQVYQGLPAKYEIPYGVERTSFSREMLDTQTQCVIRVLAVSRTLLGWLQTLLVVCGLAAIVWVRREILTGWRARFLEARQARTIKVESA